PGPDAPATDVSIQTVGGGVNNCYGEYFTNRWSTSCSNALKAGNYRTKAECDGSTKYGAWVYVSKGSVARGFSEGTCYPAIVRYAEAQYSAP
ncbi:MAG: hypothetical protein IRZ07_25525, partial [Microbispora sp.]|nr:hypothetical protein [Microbispora sp.]